MVPVTAQSQEIAKPKLGFCYYKGVLIAEGTKKQITNCEFCTCKDGKVACYIVDCPMTKPGCKAIYVKGECCPRYECNQGCQYEGTFIPEGETVEASTCTFCHCYNGEAACYVVDCAMPPEGCKAIPSGQCCPSYDCSPNCYYQNQVIEDKTSVNITPCETCECNNGNISCYERGCPAPSPGCFYDNSIECCSLVCCKS